MFSDRTRKGRLYQLGVLAALALFACAEFHGIVPLLGVCDLHVIPGHGSSHDPTSSDTQQPCGLCVLVQSLVLTPEWECVETPTPAVAFGRNVPEYTFLWSDVSWTPESVRGPPLPAIS